MKCLSSCFLAGVLLGLAGMLPLSSLAQSAPARTASAALGSGPGVHSPNSPIAPLPERADVVPWALLTAVRMRDGRKGPRPVFNAQQLALHFRMQRVQGFMMPLEPGEKQTHFLLSAVPLTCSFCIPGGPESMVEVFARTAVKYTTEPLTVEGKFAVLEDDSSGMYYRMTHAVSVR